jgi:predicted NBD/HSP70 family sugar kinase
MEGFVLVLEAGGTTLRAARFHPTPGQLLGRVAVPTPLFVRTAAASDGDGDGDASILFDAIRQLGDVALAGRTPLGVALAYPAPIDRDGCARATPTVLGSGGPSVDVRARLADAFPGLPVTILNDLTAAGYRQVASGNTDFCIVTVGSGIGHKQFVNGVPLAGAGGRGGEIGHLMVDPRPDARRCDCGGLGHLGAIASGRGAVALVHRQAVADPDGFGASWLGRSGLPVGAIDGPDVASAYVAADAWTRLAVRPAVDALGWALAALHLDVGTERFVLIGGFARALGEGYRADVAAAAASRCWNDGLDWADAVESGADDDDHALLGGGWYAAGRLLRERPGIS